MRTSAALKGGNAERPRVRSTVAELGIARLPEQRPEQRDAEHAAGLPGGIGYARRNARARLLHTTKECRRQRRHRESQAPHASPPMARTAPQRRVRDKVRERFGALDDGQRLLIEMKVPTGSGCLQDPFSGYALILHPQPASLAIRRNR
jgi:hypothetical protein